MKSFFSLVQIVLLLVVCQQCFSQVDEKPYSPPPKISKARVTHGPVIGGVTDHSARIYIRTNEPIDFHLLLYNEDNTLYANLNPSTIAERDTSVIVELENLNADYEYHYELFVKGRKERMGSFRTFPKPNDKKPFTFAFGSCMEQQRGDSIFIELKKEKPVFFMHLGDWTYPDHAGYPDDKASSPNFFYSREFNKVQEAYRVRYSMPNMNKFMESTPMDFIHDDDDFVYDGNSRSTQSGSYIKNKKTILFEEPLPEGARFNAIRGYMDYFPHYPIEHDTSNGVYHKFRYGNVEVFFIDSRANRSSENEAFKVNKKGKMTFAPDSNHTILGKEQMAWLLDGLQKSTADWKFIASGTNFNMGYRRAIDLALRVQNKELQAGWSGGVIASSMSAMWVGYPHDQAKLINFCADNKIKNVIVLSGDAHSSCIDDGKNAGLPELVGANLSVPNTKIPSILYNKAGLDLWDIGAQGVNNDNYNNCFGKVDVYGQDSVGLNVVDEHGTVVVKCILKNGIQAKHVNLRDMAGNTFKTRRQRRRDTFALIKKTMENKRKKKA